MKRSFTLLEVCICLALVCMLSATIGWQIKDVMAMHFLQENANSLKTDLQQLQVLAMTHQMDFELHITQDNNKCWTSHIFSDSPIFRSLGLVNRKYKSVSHFTIAHVPVSVLRLSVFSSGAIVPSGVIGLHKKRADKEALTYFLDISTPPQIHVCKQ